MRIPFIQGCLLPSLVEVGTVALEKKIFYFVIISPWKRMGSSFEQTWIPLTQGWLCQVWLKLAQWFWRRRFSKFLIVFSQFHNYLPLEKGRALQLNKLEFPSLKDTLCHVWLKLAQWFWRRRWKCRKFSKKTDKFWSEKLTWAKGSSELKMDGKREREKIWLFYCKYICCPPKKTISNIQPQKESIFKNHIPVITNYI